MSIKIVQCWDDGVHDDIRLIEILRKHHATASFNLNTNPGRGNWKFRDKEVSRIPKSDWTNIYEGFTIANHTITHPQPTQIPIEDWRSEVADARKELQDIFNQPILGFAYPFGNCNDATKQVVCECGHIYARTVKNATPCYPPADPFAFAADCHFLAPDFFERLDRAKSLDAPVFYFWGHSYELVTEDDWTDMEAKIARIATDPTTQWAELPALNFKI